MSTLPIYYYILSLSLSLSHSLTHSLTHTHTHTCSLTVAQRIFCYDTIGSTGGRTICQGRVIRVVDTPEECCVDAPKGAGYMIPANDVNQCFSCDDVIGLV